MMKNISMLPLSLLLFATPAAYGMDYDGVKDKLFSAIEHNDLDSFFTSVNVLSSKAAALPKKKIKKGMSLHKAVMIKNIMRASGNVQLLDTMVNSDGYTPLTYAAAKENALFTYALIDRRASPGKPDCMGKSALDYARSSNKQPIITLLERAIEDKRKRDEVKN